MIFAAACICAAPAAAQDPFDFYREEAQVFTASRRAEPVMRAPVAVDVITAEEIRAFGYVNIWDALRSRAGMDVIDARSADGNRAVVSARGFTRDFVAEMQVLIDGRSAYSPFVGGVWWSNIPVQIEDVERIEIVRGPNAALYGSNSVLGVINIITRRPAAPAAVQSQVYAGSHGERQGSFSVEAATASLGMRLSYEHRVDDGHPSSSGDDQGNDFLHSNKLNFRGRWSPDRATELELFSGGSWQTEGVPGFAQRPQAALEQDFEMVRGTRDLGSAGSVEAMVARTDNHTVINRFYVGRVALRTYQYDAEALHRFAWLDGRVKSAWGAGWRLSAVDSDQLFAGHPRQQNRVRRGFTHHSVDVTDRVTLVGGVSLEDSWTGGFEPAWQAAALFSPREDHVLRLSVAHAPTLPPLFNKSGDYRLSATRRLYGNPDLRPQHLHSWEAGWTARALDGALKSEVAVYFMDIKERNFYVTRPDGADTLITYENSNRALARGLEISEEYSFARGRAVFANYTLERITDAKGATDPFGTDLRRGTPVHKANIGARVLLAHGVGLSARLSYKDAYDANSTTRSTHASIPAACRFDAKVSWAPRAGLELFVAGENLFYPAHIQYPDGTSEPRTVRGGVSARFSLW